MRTEIALVLPVTRSSEVRVVSVSDYWSGHEYQVRLYRKGQTFKELWVGEDYEEAVWQAKKAAHPRNNPSRITPAHTRRLTARGYSMPLIRKLAESGSGRRKLDGMLWDVEGIPAHVDDWKQFAWIADDTGAGSNMLHFVFAVMRRSEHEKDRLPKLSANERLMLSEAMSDNPYRWMFKAMRAQVKHASHEQLIEYLVQHASK